MGEANIILSKYNFLKGLIKDPKDEASSFQSVALFFGRIFYSANKKRKMANSLKMDRERTAVD